MDRSVFKLYGLLTGIVLVTTLAWLDSLDRYLDARYHVALQAYLPDSLYQPSRYLLAVSGNAEAEAEETDEASAVESPPTAPPAKAAATGGAGKEASPRPKPAVLPVAEAKPEATGTATDDDPSAPRVLFAGDSMMQGVAPMVIPKVSKLYPKGRFSDLSKPSTGLTVRRFFDWPTKIKEEIDRNRFNTLVVFLGPNDPWDIMEGRKRYPFPSDAWVEKYRSRVAEVLDYAQSKGVHVIWIGLPNMRNDRVRQGAVLENRVFQEETARRHCDYLSTEALFGSLDDPYSRHIEMPERGKIAVRAEDGIHFTPEGLRLIGARVVDLIAARRHG